MSGLAVPELYDVDSLTAALTYAKYGWYVLPVDPTTKHPGSIVGRRWPAQSTMDAHQLAAWFIGSNYALALHAGRSGAVIFDVDHPASMPTVLREEIERADPPFQSTRDDTPGRGHYVFAMPPGRNINNSGARLGKSWGEIRGKNGIIIAEPSPHTKPHGRYRWERFGQVPTLGKAVADLLNDAGDVDDAASDAEVVAFIARHPTGDHPELLNAILATFTAAVGRAESRHGALLSALPWALREVAAGYLAGAAAVTGLRGAFIAAMAEPRVASDRVLGAERAGAEFAGVLAWAVAQAKTADPGEVRAGADQRLSDPLGTQPKPSAAPRESEQPYVAALPIERPASRLGLTPASAITIVRVRWGWQDRMPVGELTLIPGREGVGKSLLLAWLAAQLTLGTLPGEYSGTPRAVLYVASEDSWAYTVAPRLKAAGADLSKVFRVDVKDEGRLSLPADCDNVAQLAEDAGAAAVMLDPVISLIHSSLNVNQASELRRALEPLRRTAETAGLMIPALAHFNKTSDTDVLSKIPGSRAWAEVARAAFGVAEDKEAGRYVGSQIKNNLGRLNLPNLSYRIESVLIEAADGQADVGRLVWGENSDVGVEEVLGRKPERQARETSDTTTALVDYIERCGYPVALQQVYDEFPEVQQETVRQALRRAAGRGTLSSPLRGHYGPSGRVSDT